MSSRRLLQPAESRWIEHSSCQHAWLWRGVFCAKVTNSWIFLYVFFIAVHVAKYGVCTQEGSVAANLVLSSYTYLKNYCWSSSITTRHYILSYRAPIGPLLLAACAYPSSFVLENRCHLILYTVMYLLTGSYVTTSVIPRITDTQVDTLTTKRVGVAYSPAPNFEFTNTNNCK